MFDENNINLRVSLLGYTWHGCMGTCKQCGLQAYCKAIFFFSLLNITKTRQKTPKHMIKFISSNLHKVNVCPDILYSSSITDNTILCKYMYKQSDVSIHITYRLHYTSKTPVILY